MTLSTLIDKIDIEVFKDKNNDSENNPPKKTAQQQLKPEIATATQNYHNTSF